jgi:hypothetical protein
MTYAGIDGMTGAPLGRTAVEGQLSMRSRTLLATVIFSLVIAGCNTKKAGTDTGGGRFEGQADRNQKIQHFEKSTSSGQGNTAAEPHPAPDPSKRQEAAGMDAKKPAQAPQQNPPKPSKKPDASSGEPRH